MAIVAKSADQGSFVNAPQGSHQGVCCDVIDVGMVDVVQPDKSVKKVHKIDIVWQLPIVNDESELAVPDPDMIFPPAKVLPIGKTIHTMYPGCRVAATLNLYSFISGKVPGFSSSASVAVFKNDEERFGGGVSVDEDEIFMD